MATVVKESNGYSYIGYSYLTSIYNFILYIISIIAYPVQFLWKKKKTYSHLDNLVKKDLVKYVQNTKFSSYEISPESVTYLENCQLETDNVVCNLIEMVEKIAEKYPLKSLPYGYTTSYNGKRLYFAPFEIIKDYQEENQDNIELKQRFDIPKGKYALNVDNITKNEFIISFGEDRANRDMMGVSRRFLQILPEYYHSKLVAMYNKTLNGEGDTRSYFGKASFSWKGKGDKKDIKSYRKIVSLPNVVNHLHRILGLRLSEYFEKNEYFDKTIQKAGISGINNGIFEQVYKLRSVIKDANQNKQSAAVMFLDLKSAFDTINKESVFKVLEAYYVDKKIVDYLRSFYSNLDYYISSRGENSELKKWNCGLVQGCSLSPLLFTVCMNYALTYINKTSLNANGYTFSEAGSKVLFLAYMDDICITCNNADSLDEVYSELLEFFTSMGLKINKEKSAVMLINTELKENSSLKDIPVVNNQVYLGNTITSDGTYDKNYESVKRDIYSKLMNIKNSKSEDKEELFKGIYPTIKRTLLKMYDVEGEDMGKLVWMINQNLKEMDIDESQFNFDIKNTRDYVVTVSMDSVIENIPKKLNKVKNDVVKPSKIDLEDMKEAYENTKQDIGIDYSLNEEKVEELNDKKYEINNNENNEQFVGAECDLVSNEDQAYEKDAMISEGNQISDQEDLLSEEEDNNMEIEVIENHI